MTPARNGAFLPRLAHDTAGTTLAIAAASILALMGVVGGAVDISRAYMAQSRLQQACDAGALAARKALAGERLTDAEKATGYRYFDFNFPAGTYDVALTSRTYSQPTNSAGTPQAIVNGVVRATVPTKIMQVFGKETIELEITCSSKMEISNADVAMVLDVTASMNDPMTIGGGASGTEPRINALHRAVKAFYDALGPGRASGDLSKGRIRYGFVPYGITVNVANLLTHQQMVDDWSYESVEYVPGPHRAWTLSNPVDDYDPWSAPPQAFADDAGYNTPFALVSGSNSSEFTMQDGTVTTKRRTDATNTTQCNALNKFGTLDELFGIQQTEGSATETYTQADAGNDPPVWPNTVQNLDAEETRTATVTWGYKYRYFNNGGTNGCWLERASKRTNNNSNRYTQTRTGTATRAINWTTYPIARIYGTRSFTVSGLKSGAGGWNQTISLARLRGVNLNNQRTVKLSGSNANTTVWEAGTPDASTVTWRGCIEERQMDNTITASTPHTSVPAAALDLDTTVLATAGNNQTRWRPWLSGAYYIGGSVVDSDDSDCPSPALRLQEIGNYNTTILDTSSYTNLFDPASGGAESFYYPFDSSLWAAPNGTPTAERSKNTATLRNYINRIKRTSGTTHDIGFVWGLHLVSGEGMFAGDNPDRFNGQVVSRNIVFMTDGEMNPGEERYVFSGYNQRDGRMAPTATGQNAMIDIENRRLRIACEAAKRQGITVWVVAITSTSTESEDYEDLRSCASSRSNFKTAATSTELINQFTTIAQSIGGLRISQ